MVYASTLSLFLADGTAEGLKIIEKSNWNGCGLVCPRVLFPQHKTREELTKPGVYLLVGKSDDEGVGRRLYIGEGDPTISRVSSHYREKDWWNEVIVFTAKDQTLNKAFVQFFEAELVQKAVKTGRYQIENGNRPIKPSLSEKDRAICEGFMRELLLCLPILGIGLHVGVSEFENADGMFFISSKGIDAKGGEVADGFVVFAGSEAVIKETNTVSNGIRKIRQGLFEQGVLQDREGGKAVFVKDFLFGSPSTASSVVLGASTNGRDTWRNKAGETLKVVQLAKIES